MTFKEEIKKLIIEKILLGFIIGLAIYGGTIHLEKMKVEENFKFEMNKIRILKIAEVWEKISDFEDDFYVLYNAVETGQIDLLIKGERKTEKNVYKLESVNLSLIKLQHSREELFDIISKNSFYLGKNLEKQVLEFYHSLLIIDKFQKISLDPQLASRLTPELNNYVKDNIEQFRANFSQVRNYLLDGGY